MAGSSPTRWPSDNIAEVWGKLYNLDKRIDVQAFLVEYGHLIPEVKVDLSELEGKVFREKFMKMKGKRAVAADGWRVRELRDLPIPLLNMGAMLVQEVEKGEDGHELIAWALSPQSRKEEGKAKRRRSALRRWWQLTEWRPGR